MTAHAQSYYQTLEVAGAELTYALLLPPDYEPGTAYPTLLALPPGPQSQAMVEAGLSYWRSGPQRGWVVISPVAHGPLFFQGSERYLPDLLGAVQETITFEGGKVHVAGISNGGRSAFRITTLHPEYFHSLMALPGFPPSEADYESLERINALPIVLYAGEYDSAWVEEMMRTKAALEALGADVRATIVAGEGHVIQSLSGQTLFGLLETFR